MLWLIFAYVQLVSIRILTYRARVRNYNLWGVFAQANQRFGLMNRGDVWFSMTLMIIFTHLCSVCMISHIFTHRTGWIIAYILCVCISVISNAFRTVVIRSAGYGPGYKLTHHTPHPWTSWWLPICEYHKGDRFITDWKRGSPVCQTEITTYRQAQWLFGRNSPTLQLRLHF